MNPVGCYRRLLLVGVAGTWVVAVALQPRRGHLVGAGVTWIHIAALAPLCWLWLAHPRFAMKLLVAAIAGTLLAVAFARRPGRPRYH